MRLGEGKSDRRTDALPERAGRDLDAGRNEVLGMPRCFTFPLPVAFKLVHRQVITDQMRQTVLEHRAVTGRLNVAVAVDPAVVGRIELHKLGVERVTDRRCAQRHSGMPGTGGLERVDSQRANGIDGAFLQRLTGGCLGHSFLHSDAFVTMPRVISKQHSRAPHRR